MKTDNLSNQLRWVILLLTAAVILPTVCLLWFMNQAVQNERLAVRQKLVDFYTKRGKYFFVEVPNLYFAGHSDHFINSYPIDETSNFFDLYAVGEKSFFQGMLIYDKDGNLLYPSASFQIEEESESSVPLFSENTQESIDLAYQLSYPDNPERLSPARAANVMRYRVFLAERLFEANDERLHSHLRRALGNFHFHDEKETGFLIGPMETTLWQFERLIALANRAGLADRLETQIQSAKQHITAYENVLEAASVYPAAESLVNWPDQTVGRLAPNLDLYGFKLSIASQTVIGILTPDKSLKILNGAIQDMRDDTVRIQVSDNFGAIIAGDVVVTEKPFLTLKAGKFLPEFTVSFFFRDTSVFEKAAHRQTSIYIWTGVLVALLILLAGVISIRAVSHQIKMNRLKNDFIATVTHELKTPLSSMRLLVDTLLEGRYEDEKTVPEYLGLIANENKRLSHLIDSFLTFSRMERNKQVLDFQTVSPAEIAIAGIEATQGKLNSDGCCFTSDIQTALPTVRADKDAMVTVLVNLLENACKYSGEDKQIALNVFEENGEVCFTVRDNGVGISRRAQKRIFNRFYQVDNRLSRSVEGCGLGLSIVQFIVDAHKGQIDIESRPGEGSTFTIRLKSLK